MKQLHWVWPVWLIWFNSFDLPQLTTFIIGEGSFYKVEFLPNILSPYLHVVHLPNVNAISDLVIDETVSNQLNGTLNICGYNQLETITIKANALKDIIILKIWNNEALKSIIILDNALRNLRKIELLSLTFLYLFIWSSSIDNIHHRREFFQIHNFIVFDQFDWFDSTHWIFLN